jgi:hypothetical protein
MIELRHRTSSRGYQALSAEEQWEDECDSEWEVVTRPRALQEPTYFSTAERSRGEPGACE